MRITFKVESAEGVYLVSLSSGQDAFFSSNNISETFSKKVEIIEVDLKRVSGNLPTSLHTLSLISEGIGRYFISNDKAVLYYYCDDLADVPKSNRKSEVWPQEYRSQLFSMMFQRFLIKHDMVDVIDLTVMIEQGDRPLYMHLIARKEHSIFIEEIKRYIIENYGK